MSSGEPSQAVDIAAGTSVPPAVRAQFLATEHWSLLATRGMTWSEVMSRITVHLTVASASLVVLALVTQAAGYGTAFRVLSVGLASAILVLGTLTGVRVHNASEEDAVLLAGMNRLRAAYVEMDPSLSDYLVTSWYDDQAGVMRTYTMGIDRHMVSHIVGSTSMFINIVNTVVAGTLGALVANAAGGGPLSISLCGSLAAAAYLAAMLVVSRSFRRLPLDVRFPSPPAP
jgi:hypothetical protein